jgi:hypothetical protein
MSCTALAAVIMAPRSGPQWLTVTGKSVLALEIALVSSDVNAAVPMLRDEPPQAVYGPYLRVYVKAVLSQILPLGFSPETNSPVTNAAPTAILSPTLTHSSSMPLNETSALAAAPALPAVGVASLIKGATGSALMSAVVSGKATVGPAAAGSCDGGGLATLMLLLLLLLLSQ